MPETGCTYTFVRRNGLLINADYLSLLEKAGLAGLRELKAFSGGEFLKKTSFRTVERVHIDDKVFYLKRHYLRVKERLKRLVPFAPQDDARNEWKSMVLLRQLGFNTMTPVAFGEERKRGLPGLSLTVTEHIYGAEVFEDYIPRHFTGPLATEQIATKRIIIRRFAEVARDFHGKGLRHQDFYLGHFFLDPAGPKFWIIDLQRVRRSAAISPLARLKDLGQLCFSSTTVTGITRTDRLRFYKVYAGAEHLSPEDKRLIRLIVRKAVRISRHTEKVLARRRKK